MIVCLCEGLSDRELRAAIRRGCGSVPDLARETGAAKHCGSCACDLKRLLAEDRDDRELLGTEELALAAK